MSRPCCDWKSCIASAYSAIEGTRCCRACTFWQTRQKFMVLRCVGFADCARDLQSCGALKPALACAACISGTCIGKALDSAGQRKARLTHNLSMTHMLMHLAYCLRWHRCGRWHSGRHCSRHCGWHCGRRLWQRTHQPHVTAGRSYISLTDDKMGVSVSAPLLFQVDRRERRFRRCVNFLALRLTVADRKP